MLHQASTATTPITIMILIGIRRARCCATFYIDSAPNLQQFLTWGVSVCRTTGNPTRIDNCCVKNWGAKVRLCYICFCGLLRHVLGLQCILNDYGSWTVNFNSHEHVGIPQNSNINSCTQGFAVSKIWESSIVVAWWILSYLMDCKSILMPSIHFHISFICSTVIEMISWNVVLNGRWSYVKVHGGQNTIWNKIEWSFSQGGPKIKLC